MSCVNGAFTTYPTRLNSLCPSWSPTLFRLDENQRPHYTDGHGTACVHLRLSTNRRTVLVEVWDENVRPPEPTPAGLDDESGRGLMLVEALTERWGWDQPANGRGKIVRALLEI